MKKNILKVVSLVLVVMTVLLTCACAFATNTDTPVDEIEPTRYANIGAATLSFVISGVTANCGASLTAKKSCSLQIVMTLQKKNSSGTWSNVKTWSATKTGINLALSQSRLINVLSTYRLKGTFTAGGETTTIYRYA